MWRRWQESRLVSKSDLHEAMDRVKPAVKHRKSDNMSALMKTLVEGMRGRAVQASDGYHSEAGGGVDGKQPFTEEAGATAEDGPHEETQTEDQAGEESVRSWALEFEAGRVVPLQDGSFSIGEKGRLNVKMSHHLVSYSSRSSASGEAFFL